jgi:two-component system, cell cycle sensor histidine kinase and response regulator CckA
VSRNLEKSPLTTARPLRLLIVDDDPADLALCLRELKKSEIPFEAETATKRNEFIEKLRAQPFDIVLSDYRMKDWSGMDALALTREIRPGVPVILLTGTLGDELAVQCIQQGVADYVLKDQISRLPMTLHRAKEDKDLRVAEEKALEALRESEAHYRILVENAPEAIIVLDVDSNSFLDCNANASRLFQVTREHLLGLSPGDLSPLTQPDGRNSRAVSGERVEKALAGPIPAFEWMICNSKGESIPCEVHLVRLPSPNRRLIRGSITDTSERSRADAALRESEARYRGLVNNATYGIYWVSLTGDLVDVNPALVQMLGYDSAKDLLAIRSTNPLFCDETARANLRAEFAGSGRVDVTVNWKRKDGKVITVRLNGRSVKSFGQGAECVEVIVEDVTERIALEKQLVQAQKFEGIGQLAGGIAHDFNNMIGAIIGWADIGMEETEPSSRLRRHFEKVRQQADRAAALTKQLLAFARRQILEPRDIDLNRSITETLSLLEKVLGSNIEIKAKLASELALVRADPTQFEQILMNLCINARDAMPSGGLLIIETKNSFLDAAYCAAQPLARPGQYAVLAVTDSGTGMDGATLDRIFEPFFTTKELGKGTGLGLATVYGIIRQHGGFIQVYSEVGVGTTFRAYLPTSSAAAASPQLAEDTRPARGGSEMILVAEDHEGLRQLAFETLTHHGYQVLLASDGEQAINEFILNRNRVDLAFLDVVMPKFSGPEVYARICAEKAGVPVIFATGYSADISVLQNAQQQGLPIIQKPYSPRILARKIREALDHNLAQRAELVRGRD